MKLQLLPPAARAIRRRRWSFRFSSLTSVAVIAGGAWQTLPDAWHPLVPVWAKWVAVGVSVLLALAANGSHFFVQTSAMQPAPTVPPSLRS